MKKISRTILSIIVMIAFAMPAKAAESFVSFSPEKSKTAKKAIRHYTSSLWTRALYSKRLSLTLAAMKSPSSSWTNRPAIVRNNFEIKEVDV